MQDKVEIRNTGACFPADVADRVPHSTGTHCCIHCTLQYLVKYWRELNGKFINNIGQIFLTTPRVL